MSDSQASATPAIAQGPLLVLAPGTPTTVAAALAERVAEWPDGTIRTYGVDGSGRAQSYRELWRRSGAIAVRLRKFCHHPGDTVVLLIEDAVDFAPAFWACIRGGFVAVPLMSVAREAFHQRRGGALREALNRLSNVNILADEKFAELADALRLDRGLPVLSLASAETESADLEQAGSPAEPLCLVPTSGSTGRLKLVAVGQGAVLHRSFADTIKKDLNYLGSFALDSVTAQNGVFLRYGSWTQMPAAVFTAKPTSTLDAIEQYQITTFALTNSALKRIMAAAAQTSRTWKLGSLRQIGLGAETVVPKVVQRLGQFLEQQGASSDIIRAGYGTTETGILVRGANPLDRATDHHDAVCLGECAPGVGLRIVGSDGEVLAAGEIGELQTTCQQKIFTCYWGEPEATRECFTADRWWRTGDLGRLQNGELSLHGRAKELLIVQGKKFSLSEIDTEIETVLAVGDRAFSCAIHWPEEATERLAVVFVAADAGAERRAELAEMIRSIVARRFGFRPDPVVAASLDAIPLAANGKLRRLELAANVRSGTLVPIEGSGHFQQQAVQNAAVQQQAAGRAPNEIFDLEKTLAQIWREVLDITGDLDRHASFFDLGGDSLRSVMLNAAIEEKFGKQISAEAFFASPTFASLSALIADGNGASPPVNRAHDAAVPWPLPTVLRNKLLLHFETWDGDRPTRDRLVSGVNMAGTRTPLFWVFQDAVQFRRLAGTLDLDQPLYALRSGADVIEYKEDEIQALALRYVSEISEVCPEGSVFVGGACQGAIIALAVAQHLLRRRRHVPLLALVDWGFPLQPYPGPVLLLYGRDSVFGRQYRHPDLSWRRAFAQYVVAETPGDHANLFDPGYIEAWSEILVLHMQKTERSSPTLIPKLAHRAVIIADQVPSVMVCGRQYKVDVRLRNTSPITWPAWDKSGLTLANRWLDEAGTIIEWMDGRVPLPELKPGGEVQLGLPITAPRLAGAMQLTVDVVEEGSSWFNTAQNAPLRARVEIRPEEASRDRSAMLPVMKS